MTLALLQRAAGALEPFAKIAAYFVDEVDHYHQRRTEDDDELDGFKAGDFRNARAVLADIRAEIARLEEKAQ